MVRGHFSLKHQSGAFKKKSYPNVRFIRTMKYHNLWMIMMIIHMIIMIQILMDDHDLFFSLNKS